MCCLGMLSKITRVAIYYFCCSDILNFDCKFSIICIITSKQFFFDVAFFILISDILPENYCTSISDGQAILHFVVVKVHFLSRSFSL
jgi:hypothetical protein